MSTGRMLLTAFLLLLALHLAISMELPLVAWAGAAACLVGGFRLVQVERPTWGLLFVLFTTGGLFGNQLLEDWAVEGSWPQDNGFGAGMLLSLLVYLVWLHAARLSPEQPLQPGPVDRDQQTILVWGLLVMLLMTPPEPTVVMLLGEPAPMLSLLAIPLACLVLLADRCGGSLLPRLLWLVPVLASVPLVLVLLGYGQGPVVAALGNLFPRSDNYTATGFSPYQTLRASAFLRPSNRAVMRIESGSLPSRYLAGNRLVALNEDLVWLPSGQALRSYNTLDAEPLPDGQWRYAVDNHHFASAALPNQGLTVHSLDNESYVFVTPGTSHVSGRFNAISRNAADVWTPAFERGADRRWQLEAASPPRPDNVSDETLSLPEFWDASLQDKSREFAGTSRQQTADNIVQHFTGRQYTLRTEFDPSRPFHDFFLNERAAYCFWFASGATLALRANGVPSRLVGGYLIHEQLTDELWLVRERDAHSWVEWQDENGYWHTMDPTPASINAFFGGYDSSTVSSWYHILAGRWQMLIDRILEDELAASMVQYGGLAILIFLFAREYRRLRGRRDQLDDRTLRWQRLWQRFLARAALPDNVSWTASDYADHLPENWPPARSDAVRNFLRLYNRSRFAAQDESALAEMEDTLKEVEALGGTL